MAERNAIKIGQLTKRFGQTMALSGHNAWARPLQRREGIASTYSVRAGRYYQLCTT